MCSPSNVFQLIATWADIAAVDGLSTGIQGGVWSLLGMCALQIQIVAALTIAVCGVSLMAYIATSPNFGRKPYNTTL